MSLDQMLNGDDVVASTAASTPALDDAVRRGRETMRQQFNITRIPRSHLHALATAMLDGYLDQTQAKRLIDQAVKAERDRLQAAHQAAMDKLKTEHANDLIDVDDRITGARAEARAIGIEHAKRSLRAKHKQLTNAVAAVDDARELVKACAAWSGPESWRDDALKRLDELHATLDPNDIH